MTFTSYRLRETRLDMGKLRPGASLVVGEILVLLVFGQLEFEPNKEDRVIIR